METIMEPPFFCFCGKQFSSGKAMGGHKKVHSHKLRRSSEDDGPGKKKNPSPNLNNLKGGAGAGAVISARTENGKPDVPPKKRKVIMEDGDGKNSQSTAAVEVAERYFCGICGVYFQSHRSLAAHSGHHTKAARKMLPSKVDESSSSSSSSGDDHSDEDYDVNEDSDSEEAESEAEKRMAFKCPYNCERVFRSGKALGGHKRHCRNRAAAAAGLAGGHGQEAAAAADEDRNGGGDNRINRLGFDLNEVPDSEDDEYNAAE